MEGVRWVGGSIGAEMVIDIGRMITLAMLCAVKSHRRFRVLPLTSVVFLHYNSGLFIDWREPCNPHHLKLPFRMASPSGP
jgi:hypothetical protein